MSKKTGLLEFYPFVYHITRFSLCKRIVSCCPCYVWGYVFGPGFVVQIYLFLILQREIATCSCTCCEPLPQVQWVGLWYVMFLVKITCFLPSSDSVCVCVCVCVCDTL